MVEAKECVGGGERERGGDETREVQVCRGCSLFKLNKAVIFCVSAVCERWSCLVREIAPPKFCWRRRHQIFLK